MQKIKLEKLEDFISTNKTDGENFVGYTSTIHYDMNGDEYELQDSECVYCYLGSQLGNNIFISRSVLFESLLQKEIDSVENGDIYSHGYPESRLIPENHAEQCQEAFINEITDSISDDIDNTFSHLF